MGESVEPRQLLSSKIEKNVGTNNSNIQIVGPK